MRYLAGRLRAHGDGAEDFIQMAGFDEEFGDRPAVLLHGGLDDLKDDAAIAGQRGDAGPTFGLREAFNAQDFWQFAQPGSDFRGVGGGDGQRDRIVLGGFRLQFVRQ